MKKSLLIPAALCVLSLSAQAWAECVAVEASAPAPTVTAAPAAAVAAPVVAPALSAPVASQAGKTTAVILRAVALRDRPQLNSMGEVVAPADKRVRLERSVNNGAGVWWYVVADGLGGGWVLESEMGGQQQ